LESVIGNHSKIRDSEFHIFGKLVEFYILNAFRRAGFLTRLIHGPTDFVLAICKIYHSMVDLNLGSKLGVNLMVVLINGFWFYTRVYWYGILVFQHLVMFYNDPRFYQPIELSMMTGSIFMWILQVIWLVGIFSSTIPLIIRGETKIFDPMNAEREELAQRNDVKKMN